MIDGQTRHIGDLKPGTVLTATVTTTTRPVTVRTTSVLNGTVWWVQGNYVVLTLENGENHEYHVPASFKFVVEGKPASVSELEARHEGIGHQDRRRAPYRAHVEYGHHGQVTQVGYELASHARTSIFAPGLRRFAFLLFIAATPAWAQDQPAVGSANA
mgnify:CR=1 FL=1